MAVRPPRLLTSLIAGGLVTGSLLLGAGSALAAPAADDVVEARCGQTVRAEEGQTLKIIPTLGLPFEREVRTGMKPISELVGGILCRVQVQVVEPASEQVAQAAPPLRQATEQLSGTTGAVLDAPRSAATATPRSRAAVPTPAAAAPTFTPRQAAAAAPAFAPAFSALPSSFLKGAAGPAPGLRAFDPNLLLGSAFPGLRAGSPAYLGYDPASAVTTASQVQALPVDALTEGGVGVPALIAVLALSGVAAFTVRRVVLGRPAASSSVGGAAAAPVADAEPADEVTAEVAEDRDEDADEQAELDEAAGTTVSARTPVPA